MFDSLSTRIQDVFTSLRGEVRLTPELVETALREIRLALLEADVNFKVVKPSSTGSATRRWTRKS
jgi:signal recognition particle subunit SRP54